MLVAKTKEELISRLEGLITEFKDSPPVTVPPSKPVLKETLQKGAEDPLVGLAQAELKKFGFKITMIDNRFGDETEAAIKAFQEANKIGTSGKLGPQTWAALFSATAKGPIKVASGVVAAAELARVEAKANYHWRASGGPKSVAEKYLASVRGLIGMPVNFDNIEACRFPWCAAFIFWCLKQCGVDMSELKSGAAYVPSWVAWAKKKGYWHPANERSFNPRLGDIGINDWNDRGTEDPEHISFILSYDGARTLQTAEGNTSSASDGNGDQTALRTRDWDDFEGFIRIA